jgi:hypothetical protein
VRKPALKPHWIGNPELDQAMRQTLRAKVMWQGLTVEGALSAIQKITTLRSVELISEGAELVAQSFTTVDAHVAEAQLSYRRTYFKTLASFAWGENLDEHEPLAEIAPVTLTSAVTLPVKPIHGTIALKHTWSAPQRRVSLSQDEKPTGAWNRLDLSMHTAWDHFDLAVEVSNLLDHNYTQHMSYARNPFARGDLIYEAGRALRFSLKASFKKRNE